MRTVILGPASVFLVLMGGTLACSPREPGEPQVVPTSATETATPADGGHSSHQDTPCPEGPPLGALPPAVPVWCQLPLETGASTFASDENSWIDDFNHGLAHATLGDGYRVFERAGAQVTDSLTFRHNDHWMVDVRANEADFGGSTMRPDRSFRFEDGALLIEADVAAGMTAYGGNAWVEIGVTLAPSPTGVLADPLYAYGIFGGTYSFGCRLQADRTPICALYAPDGTRAWEMSYFQHVAPRTFGGYPGDVADGAWRACGSAAPDNECRDHFRLELREDSITLYVRGQRYFEQRGDQLLPPELVEGDVYVYFSSWVYRPSASVTRFHWDRIAVNP